MQQCAIYFPGGGGSEEGGTRHQTVRFPPTLEKGEEGGSGDLHCSRQCFGPLQQIVMPIATLVHWLDLELQFSLLMDFLSFSSSEVPKLCDRSTQNGEKNHFLAPASRVCQKF